MSLGVDTISLEPTALDGWQAVQAPVPLICVAIDRERGELVGRGRVIRLTFMFE
jgi:hypothetical protein